MDEIFVIDLSPIRITCGICEKEVPIRQSVGWPWDNGDPILDGHRSGMYQSVCIPCSKILEKQSAEVPK